GRAGQRLAELRKLVEISAIGSKSVGLREQNRIVPAGSEFDQRGNPFPQGVRTGDTPFADRPFEPVAVGERADRKSRGQPCSEPQQRRRTVALRRGRRSEE